MSATLKKKLCWNCEGRVSLEQENCTYCGVYLGPAPSGSSSQDIMTPPYRLVESEDTEDSSDEIPASPYKTGEGSIASVVQEELDMSIAKQDLRQIVLPIALLSAGAICLLFGLVLWLFSTNGTFSLSWNSDYWYVYLGLSFMMILLGWRSLQNCDAD